MSKNSKTATSTEASAASATASFPQPLVLAGTADPDTIQQRLQAFRIEWSAYAKAAAIASWPAERQTAALLAAIGPDGAHVYHDLVATMSKGERQSAEALLDAIVRHLLGNDKRLRRVQFAKQVRYDNEPYARYLQRLRTHVDGCQYGHLRDDVLLDKIIASVNNDELSDELCSMDGLTLAAAEERCLREDKNAAGKAGNYNGVDRPTGKPVAPAPELPLVKGDKKTKPKNTHQDAKKVPKAVAAIKVAASESASGSASASTSECGGDDDFEVPCHRCGDLRRGYDHMVSPTVCPAHNHKCNKCGQLNHNEFVCGR